MCQVQFLPQGAMVSPSHWEQPRVRPQSLVWAGSRKPRNWIEYGSQQQVCDKTQHGLGGDNCDLGTWILNTLFLIAVWPSAAPGQPECREGTIPLTNWDLALKLLPSFPWPLSYGLYSHSPPWASVSTVAYSACSCSWRSLEVGELCPHPSNGPPYSTPQPLTSSTFLIPRNAGFLPYSYKCAPYPSICFHSAAMASV